MGRRRRRHADPAHLPRRAPQQREEQARREAALRDLLRAHEALARTTSILGAATIYFGAWVADVALGLFPPPQGFDPGHPQLVLGIAVLVASLFVTRYLARAVPTARLVRYGVAASLALGVVLLAFVATALLRTDARAVELLVLAIGIGFSWLLATLWLVLLGRRVRRLQPLAR